MGWMKGWERTPETDELTLKDVRQMSKEDVVDALFDLQIEMRDMVPIEEVEELQDELYEEKKKKAQTEVRDLMEDMKELMEVAKQMRELSDEFEENFEEFKKTSDELYEKYEKFAKTTQEMRKQIDEYDDMRGKMKELKRESFKKYSELLKGGRDED